MTEQRDPAVSMCGIVDAALGTSEVTWIDLRHRLTSHTVTWTDQDGLHLTAGDSLPVDRPRYASHLWAWDGERLARARLTERTIHLATIVVDEDAALGDTELEWVRVRHETGLRLWDARGVAASLTLAGDTPGDVVGRSAEVFTVISAWAAGLAFLRVAA
jgi:hypothetical protein